MFPLHQAVLDLLEIFSIHGQAHARLYIEELEMSSPEDIAALKAILWALAVRKWREAA